MASVFHTGRRAETVIGFTVIELNEKDNALRIRTDSPRGLKNWIKNSMRRGDGSLWFGEEVRVTPNLLFASATEPMRPVPFDTGSIALRLSPSKISKVTIEPLHQNGKRKPVELPLSARRFFSRKA